MDVVTLALTMRNGVDELADTKNDEVGDKLAEFGKCQEGKAEPQTEHSTEIGYVLNRLHTLYNRRDEENSPNS